MSNGNNKKRHFDEMFDNCDDCHDCNHDILMKGNNPNKDPNKDPNKKPRTDNDEDDDLVKLARLLTPSKTTGNVNNNANRLRPNKKIEILCRNPLCNHKTFEEDPTPVTIPNISVISSINDLIELGKSFHCKKNTEYAGMNLRIMCNLIVPLTQLSQMIGMETVKSHIINQILFFLQGNHTSGRCNNCADCAFNLPCLNSQTEMLHTVITGPPGVGKTEFGKILGKVYKEMGILTKGTFKLVTRADLIGEYLGHTAVKTQKVIDEAKGGILFIDEAYSLGNSELRDSFSKECIDTLNQNLTERRDFLCIIAGYENELEKCFFKYNAGLRRRFTFRYNMVPYDYEELLRIFEHKVSLINWEMSYTPKLSDTKEILERKLALRDEIMVLFKRNSKCFPNYGGDMETLLLICKIVNTKRCTFGDDSKKRTLSVLDIEEGLADFVKHRKYEKGPEKGKSKVVNVDLDTDMGIYS